MDVVRSALQLDGMRDYVLLSESDPDARVVITREDLGLMIYSWDASCFKKGEATVAAQAARHRFIRALHLLYPDGKVNRLRLTRTLAGKPFVELFEVWMEIQKAGSRESFALKRLPSRTLHAARGSSGHTANWNQMSQVFTRLINVELDSTLMDFIVNPAMCLDELPPRDWQRAPSRKNAKRSTSSYRPISRGLPKLFGPATSIGRPAMLGSLECSDRDEPISWSLLRGGDARIWEEGWGCACMSFSSDPSTVSHPWQQPVNSASCLSSKSNQCGLEHDYRFLPTVLSPSHQDA